MLTASSASGDRSTPLPHAGNEITASWRAGRLSPGWRRFLPGITLVGVTVLGAEFLTERYRAPTALLALALGLALSFLGRDPRLAPGLRLATVPGLRVGLVLMGFRVTIGQIAALGPLAPVLVAGAASVTILVAIALARPLGLSRSFGLLAGGAVAICGASAAMAIASLLDRRLERNDLPTVLISVALASATAMLCYPLITRAIGLDDADAGFVIGASIHDVAQAVAAGFSLSSSAGETAVIVKLFRVALLAPLLSIAAVLLSRQGGGTVKLLPPWFVSGFFCVALLHSCLPLPAEAIEAANTLSTGLLLCAVAAAAIGAEPAALLKTGARPIVIVGAASVTMLAGALGAERLLEMAGTAHEGRPGAALGPGNKIFSQRRADRPARPHLTHESKGPIAMRGEN